MPKNLIFLKIFIVKVTITDTKSCLKGLGCCQWLFSCWGLQTPALNQRNLFLLFKHPSDTWSAVRKPSLLHICDAEVNVYPACNWSSDHLKAETESDSCHSTLCPRLSCVSSIFVLPKETTTNSCLELPIHFLKGLDFRFDFDKKNGLFQALKAEKIKTRQPKCTVVDKLLLPFS